MKERELRDLIADVKIGRLSRRAFVQRMIAVGLTAPMAGMMLSHSGVAMAATAIPYKPTKAGGGGLLKLLYWQAVTLLNPHFAVGTKDQEGSPGSVPGRRNSEQGQRWSRRGRPLGGLEVEAGRQMA